jgi:hypothetical protein
MEAAMVYRYVSESYWRFLWVALLAVCVAFGVTWKENRDLEIEKGKTPPICLVNSPNGINVCAEAPQTMPLLEPETPIHNYVPAAP